MTSAAPGPDVARASVSLMGRTRELAALRGAASATLEDGRARGATLLGGVGAGKSALLDALAESLREEDRFRVLRVAARSRDRSHGVIDDLLRQRFGVGELPDDGDAAERMRRVIGQILDDRRVGDVCYFLGPLVGIAFPESPLTGALADDPEQTRRVQRAVLRRLLDADARRRPLCILLDDAEQCDEDSLDVLAYLLENLDDPVLLVVAAAPELLTRRPDWARRGTHEVLRLGPLAAEEAEALMRMLLAERVAMPPEELVAAGVRLAGGTPGVLRQSVRLFEQAGVLRPGADPAGPWSVHLDALLEVRLPLGADEALTARLGALSAADRAVLEHAAVVGQVSWLGALLSLQRAERRAPDLWIPAEPADGVELGKHLEALAERGHLLLLGDSVFRGEREVVLKSADERKRLLASVPARTLERQHRVVADWLLLRPEVAESDELLAGLAAHLEAAGDHAEAGRAYLRAAGRARSKHALEKAAQYLGRGLELLGESDAVHRMDALHDRGDALLVLGRRDEALAAFREMLHLAHRLDAAAKGGVAHNRIGRLHREAGEVDAADAHLRSGLALFERADDRRGMAASHDDLGRLHWLRGEYRHAVKEHRLARDLRRELGDRRGIALTLSNLGLVWADHGRPERARDAVESALRIRREIHDPIGLVDSLVQLGRLALTQRDARRALTLLEEAAGIARELGDRNRRAVVLTGVGEALLQLGEADAAADSLRTAERLGDELGDRRTLAEAKRGLARVHLERGDLEKARDAIVIAVDLLTEIRAKPQLAAALRTLGEVTAAGAWGADKTSRAIEHFLRSIAICKEIGNEHELARSYVLFARFVRSSPDYSDNDEIARKAARLQEMADEIFARHQAALASEPDEEPA